jgi:hypothetical protein
MATRTVLTRPGKGNGIAPDAAERIEDDVTATPLCYLRSDRLGRHAVPAFLV